MKGPRHIEPPLCRTSARLLTPVPSRPIQPQTFVARSEQYLEETCAKPTILDPEVNLSL